MKNKKMKSVSKKNEVKVLKKKKVIKTYKDEKKYEENPFIIDVMSEIKVKRKNQVMTPVNKNTEVMLVNSDGEVEGHTAFMRHHEVDADKFTKLYINQLACLWDLNKTSIRVFTYILNVLKPSQDFVYFDANECIKFCGYSNLSSVYDGLLCLLSSGIIARSTKSYLFFINPTIVFNGDRITFINTYTKKKKAAVVDNPNQLSLLDMPNVSFDTEK